MFCHYSGIWSCICNGTTLHYIVVYKWKLSTDLWITTWTDKNTMWQGNNVNVLLLIFLFFGVCKDLNFKYNNTNNANYGQRPYKCTSSIYTLKLCRISKWYFVITLISYVNKCTIMYEIRIFKYYFFLLVV
jgi:hypothetical protein